MLRVGFFTPVHSLDPEVVQDYVCGQIIEQLYDAPFTMGRNHEPVPLLFAGRLSRRAGLGGSVELTGTVREDVRFSDGSPLRAEHVVESLRRVPSVAGKARIDGLGQQVRFTLHEDDPRFEIRLSHRWASIVKREGDTLTGTGPFVVRPGWTPEHVVVDRNPYALRRAYIDGVEFRVYPPSADGRPDALKRAIASGEVDFTTALARDDVAELKGVRKDFQPGISTATLSLNLEHPALGSLEVRRAIGEAIDRAAVARVCYENPHAFTARSVLPPSMWRRPDGMRHDPRRARERLLASGVHPGRPLRMLTIWGPRPYMPLPQETARVIAQQLDEIGLRVEIVPTDNSLDYRSRTAGGAYDMVLGGWIADTPDPLDFLDAMFGSQSIPNAQRPAAYANNLSRYRSDEMDAALDRYRREPAEGSLQAVMDLVTRDVPLVPLFYGPNIVVHGWHVGNVQLTAVGMPRLELIEIE
ncbi:MAG: ABC transporter substrate-binding protein [Myxococcales bacterium]|nr:ABC transporter substrate-binding protein [Myxococcales bacterium]MCB9713189.1 ABC transporter substrate-binding protein [Myxococcales bacterium]